MQRGDALEVVTIPFVKEELAELSERTHLRATLVYSTCAIIGYTGVIAIIYFIVRPMLRKLINPDDTSVSYDDTSLSAGVDIGDETLDMLNKEFDESAVGFSSDGTLQLPDLHGDEDLLKAVRALVANEPELSSQVVKAWLTEDE